ncbi:MAG: hypothetical protein CM1200mP39_30700 [Dehalococcoidia bacterium]|nr:MAG: hypothetical protein CM1200mP39_30700 [Dehalococcoidia bacterium]
MEQLDKRDVVLVGLETDVCIATPHRIIRCGLSGLCDDDATGSPWPHHQAGLRRMEQAGVTITNTKGIYYEWIRDVPSAIDMKTKIGVVDFEVVLSQDLHLAALNKGLMNLFWAVLYLELTNN